MKADRGRDQTIEQLLRRSLRAESGGPVSDACLDAETLAAWVDGGLDDRALLMVEAHASGCARCQALIGAMARSVPETPVPAPWWQGTWRVRWLVPLTAGAAAVLLWMVVPGQRADVPVAVQRESQASAEAPAAPASQLPAAPTPQLPAAPAPQLPAASTPQLRAAAPPAPPTPPAVRPPSERPQAQLSAAPEARQEVAGRVAREEAANEQRELARDRQVDERSLLKQAPPADAKAADQRALGATAGAAPARPPASTVGSLAETVTTLRDGTVGLIVSRNPSIRWRLGPGGIVHYSTNGGATWELLSTGVSSELTAGSSPSPLVCWIVGRGGVVLLTTDGRNWQRVPFPEPVDLAGVEASDARTATVTTTDRRRFRTTDSGQTWTRL